MFERKNMNLDYVRYFVKLAEVKHYTRAAEELCISQPSLSHAMRQLEGELGVELFEKRGHNTALTESGEEFLTLYRSSQENSRTSMKAAMWILSFMLTEPGNCLRD